MDIDSIRKLNGTYGKSLKQSYIDDLVYQYNLADENVITKFTALVNSNQGKFLVRHRDSLSTPIRVLMEYKNNKNTTNSNYYIEIKSNLNDVLNGDILEYSDETAFRKDYYLCLSKPMRKRDYDINYVVNCNQTFNWLGLDKPIPCWCDNSSYGTKGVIGTNYINEVDGKIVYYTQYNEKTKQIRQDMRFLFNNDEKYVYKVVDINNVVTGNVLRLVMDKAEFDPINDDVENNIAYNKWLITSDEPTETENKEYLIKAYTGLHEIHKYDSNVFIICNLEGVEDAETWEIKIDYNSNSEDVVVIEEVTGNSIMLRNNGYIGVEIVLNFTKGYVTVSQTVRMVK